MSEVQSRPAATRGRGSSRGGRGGFSSRGGSGGRASSNRPTATNGDSKHDASDSLPTLEDQGEIGELNQLYGSKVSLIKEMVPDWSDVDILYALKETNGDGDLTVERILDGSISQWGEVSNQKKDRTRSKAKDTFTTTTGADTSSGTNTRPARGGRTVEGGRGRGRATERGGRVARGRSSVAPAAAPRAKENEPLSVPTDDSSAWDNAKPSGDAVGGDNPTGSAWDIPAVSDSAPTTAATTSTPAAPEAPKSTVIPSGTQKTWANMLRQTVAPPKPTPQPKAAPAPKPEVVIEPLPAIELAVPEPEPKPIAELSAEPPQERPAPVEEQATVVIPDVALPPSKDQLTEKNVEQVADTSNPPETETAASEAADSWDPRAAALSATATPLSASHAQHQNAKAPASGYAASAIKATEQRVASRTPSYQQRRFLDQQEAVRMPGNRELDRAAVQFGAFSLNGGEEDIDGDREEPETRAQPPADSPVTQPRASLPPVPPVAVPESFPAQKPVSSLPPTMTPTGAASPHPRGSWADQTNTPSAAPIAPIAPAAQQPATTQAAASQPPTQPASQQYSRFGHSAQDQSAFPQKPFDSSYGQQVNPTAAQSQYDGFPSQQQTLSHSQQPGGAFSSAANEYSSYYTADQQNRAPYNNNYYNSFTQQQQAGQGQQDSGLGSRGGFGGYGASQATDISSQYPQSTSQSRFAASNAQDPTSGNTTPNPTAQGQQQSAQSHPQSHAGQQQQYSGQYFNHPGYNYGGQHYSQYMNQYGYGQAGYGGAPYGKGAGGLYGQPQHGGYGAGMSQHSPYDQHASAAATGYPSSLHRADSGLGSAGLGEYGRVGSAQSAAQPGLGSSGFGGLHDSFGGRGASAYGSQAGQSYNTPASQPGGGPSNAEDLKPFGDGKSGSGPSPALSGAARPGSATNAAPGPSGLPPPQAAQQGMGYGGYPTHQGLHGNQSHAPGFGMGGVSGQTHQNSAYGGYGSGGGYGGNNSFYNNQQPRHGGGWGNNYPGGNSNNY